MADVPMATLDTFALASQESSQLSLLERCILPSSQITLPSTEDPDSEGDPELDLGEDETSSSGMTDSNGEPPHLDFSIVPSSLSPPPSPQLSSQPTVILDAASTGRQMLVSLGTKAPAPSAPFPDHHAILVSPPATISPRPLRLRGLIPAHYCPPSPHEISDATDDHLRAMLRDCLADGQRLRAEAAQHRIEFSLLSIQADENGKRADVELDMMRSEVQALRRADHERRARRELSSAAAASHSIQAKYLRLQVYHDEAIAENDALCTRLQLAKRLIQEKEDVIFELRSRNETMLNRIRENREHLRELCSPGGIFHEALSPRQQPLHSFQHQQPAQHRHQYHQDHHQKLQDQLVSTPRWQKNQSLDHNLDHNLDRSMNQNINPHPSSLHQLHQLHQLHPLHPDRDHGQERFTALLQVLNQENNSAPSTPVLSARLAPPRSSASSRHTRNVQSLSSLPTTPTPTGPRNRRAELGARLLPSADLVSRTESARRQSSRYRYSSPTSAAIGLPSHLHQSPSQLDLDRSSRESTISAEDHQELARQAIQAAVNIPHPTHRQPHRLATHAEEDGSHGEMDEVDVYESRASHAASELLHHEPRESIEITSSTAGSRDHTPGSPMLLPPLVPRLAIVPEKRKESSVRRELPTSPTKRLRVSEDVAPCSRMGVRYTP